MSAAIAESAETPPRTPICRSYRAWCLGFIPVTPDAIPISAGANADRIAARLASAMRVRTLHSTVFRRGEPVRAAGAPILHRFPNSDPLDDATVLVTGRGRTYPRACNDCW